MSELSREELIEMLESMERVYIDTTHIASQPEEFRDHAKDCVKQIKSILSQKPTPSLTHGIIEELDGVEPPDEIYEYALGILNKLDFEGLSLQEKINLLVKSLLPGQKPSVSKAFIGKVTSRIYCDRKSSKAIKAHIREAFELVGFEVTTGVKDERKI